MLVARPDEDGRSVRSRSKVGLTYGVKQFMLSSARAIKGATIPMVNLRDMMLMNRPELSRVRENSITPSAEVSPG